MNYKHVLPNVANAEKCHQKCENMTFGEKTMCQALAKPQGALLHVEWHK